MSSASDAVRQRVRELRERRGWSAQALADRCQDLGLPFTRDIITSIELGRRKAVDVDELLALALALGVSPTHLLVPADPWPYAVGLHRFAERGEEGVTVLDWLTGSLPLDGDDDGLWRDAHPDWTLAERRLVERIERMREMNTRAEAFVAAARSERPSSGVSRRASRGKR
jgi:transcriptional regulator with XRE-family HTH domain